MVGGEIESPEKMSYIVLYCLTVLRLNLSGPSDMDIIRKAQTRHKTRVSQISASKLNTKAMCHFPDVPETESPSKKQNTRDSIRIGAHMAVISSAPLNVTRIHCKQAFNDEKRWRTDRDIT
jgi:hypothetical protein